MNAHDFSDFWHHHTPHSLFYPTANPNQGQQTTTLQALCTRATNEDGILDVQQHQQSNQHGHCNDALSAAQLFNPLADAHNQIRTSEQIDSLNRQHQQQLQQLAPSQQNNDPSRNVINNGSFHMSPLATMGISHGSQAAQLLAAGFPTGFGGFTTPAAPFPFNFHAMASNVTPRLSTTQQQSPPSASTTTIFDLDQSQVQRNTLEKMSPKVENVELPTLPPTLKPIDGTLECNEIQSPNNEQKRHAIAQIPIENKMELTGNAPLCQVCQSGPSNGLHFGAPRTCAACAAFFRRSVSDQKKYVCKRPQRCTLRVTDAQGYRKICRNCRLKRCIEIGMMPEKVQHKRHRREVIGVESFHSHHKIHQLQTVPTKLELQQRQQEQLNTGASNEMLHLAGHSEDMARQHYANQMAAAAQHHQNQINEQLHSVTNSNQTNPWNLTPMSNVLQNRPQLL